MTPAREGYGYNAHTKSLHIKIKTHGGPSKSMIYTIHRDLRLKKCGSKINHLGEILPMHLMVQI